MKICVAMTTYNGASYLREQLDSILAQSRLPDELIVCDDQSMDTTLELLREYSSRAPFPMTIVSNDVRLGSTKNFEQAIRLCSGDIIALCDQDDVWLPHKLEVIEQTFDNDPGLGLVFSNGELIDEHGKPLAGDMWKAFHFSRRMQKTLGGPKRYDLLLSWSFVTGATVAFRSEYRSLVLPIPIEAPTFVHDRWIAVLIAAVGRIGPIQNGLIAYRLHPSQQIGTGTSLWRRLMTLHQSSSDQLALTAIRDRLIRNPSWSPNPEFVRALLLREQHVSGRKAFGGNAARRLRGVASEFVSGRYNRYPWPFAHVLRDLLVGTR